MTSLFVVRIAGVFALLAVAAQFVAIGIAMANGIRAVWRNVVLCRNDDRARAMMVFFLWLIAIRVTLLRWRPGLVPSA